jgi:hypothetical protein
MIVLGWLVLTFVACWITFGGLVFAWAGLGLSGEIGAEAWLFLATGSFLLYLSYYNFPFVVVVK